MNVTATPSVQFQVVSMVACEVSLVKPSKFAHTLLTLCSYFAHTVNHADGMQCIKILVVPINKPPRSVYGGL